MRFDRQSKLKEGDWMGVLVDLEEKKGRHGSSFFCERERCTVWSWLQERGGAEGLNVPIIPEQKVVLLPGAQRASGC